MIIDFPEEFKEYTNLVYKLAHSCPETAISGFEDYMNIGLVALDRAIKSFDHSLGKSKFITYAWYVIRNDILQEWQNTVSRLSGCTAYHMENKQESDKINFINNTMVSITESRKSLDDRFQQENWSFKPTAPLKEIIVESGISDPEAFAQSQEMKEKVVSIIKTLGPDEQDIVYRRIFEGDTFQAIADAKNLTWRAVNYRFCKGLEKLKDKMIEAGLDIYV